MAASAADVLQIVLLAATLGFTMWLTWRGRKRLRMRCFPLTTGADTANLYALDITNVSHLGCMTITHYGIKLWDGTIVDDQFLHGKKLEPGEQEKIPLVRRASWPVVLLSDVYYFFVRDSAGTNFRLYQRSRLIAWPMRLWIWYHGLVERLLGRFLS